MPGRPTLTEEQRLQLLTWLAADYPPVWIREQARVLGWPALTDRMLHYYRHEYATDLIALRAARRATALTTGLALKEERVAQLVAHAEALARIKWVADRKTGRLGNEKAWRETLDDIAKEMGGRAQRQEISGVGGGPVIHRMELAHLSDAELTALEQLLVKTVATPET